MSFKISVLFPAYNAEKYVQEAVSSILSQTYRDFELLIADDASTDRTKEVIEGISDTRIRFYHNQENLGKTATVDKLFQHASGDLVTIHDADDISLPDRFARQVEEFRSNPRLGMCGTSFVSISETGDEVLETVYMKGNYQAILADIDNCSQFHGPTMMMKKSILDELGEIYRPYFNNNYEDTDLAYRIAEKYHAYNLQDILYRYRILSSSLCRKNVNVRNRNFYRVVVFLAHERKVNNIDSVSLRNYEFIEKYFKEVTKRYSDDPSLIHREAAEYFMYWRLNKRAINESIKAVIRRPTDILNIRTLFYCLRKTYL